MIRFDKDVVKSLVIASENSFKLLFKNNYEEFYYCSLIMSENATPYITAWSEEALKRLLLKKTIDEKDYLVKRRLYRWSYADSPYCAYGFNDFFQNVDKLFIERFNHCLSNDDYERECQLWVNSMEEAMRILDYNGMFGTGTIRKKILINAEIMPPVKSNIDRAKRLNPKETFDEWLNFTQQDEVIEIDYYSIWHPKLCNVVLVEKVNDQKVMIKLKKIFYYNDSLKTLIEGCKTPPFVLKENALYDSVLETLKNNQEIRKIIKIEVK